MMGAASIALWQRLGGLCTHTPRLAWQPRKIWVSFQRLLWRPRVADAFVLSQLQRLGI